MNARFVLVGLVLIGIAGCSGSGADSGSPVARDVQFKMHTLNAESKFEGAGVLDVNRDGKLDIFCGGFWYEGPTWTRHYVREVEAAHDYHNDFSALPMDVDGNGWTDTITSAWFSSKLSWIRNPGPATQPFDEITIDEPGPMETAMLADVNADGQPDVLPNLARDAAWYELKRDPAAARNATWQKHQLPKEAAGHGMGVGDINGDGRLDIVGKLGWAEQGANADQWTWHADFDLGNASVPIVVHDVDGDGDVDLVYGLGHDYGFFWVEQEQAINGNRIWSKHEIDRSWSQAHVVLLADLDGDGREEYFTGKRYYAHKPDPGAEDQKCLYYYTFNRANRKWTRHVIHEGGPAGTGTMTEVTDVDGDGDQDIVAPGKSGLYLFENLRRP